MILTTGALAMIPLLGVAVVRVFMEIKITEMTRDVAAIANIHPLAGMLSSIGILAWWTSASIWFFAALIRSKQVDKAGCGFFAYSGALSVYLALDDLFQIHESLAPAYLHISERAVYGLLGLATAVYIWRFRHSLMRPDGVLFVLALVFLGSSVLVDAILEPWMWRLADWQYFLEDGMKWLGICFWTTFCVIRCSAELRSSHRNPA
ncbi:MAG: hypothetical protein ACKVQQ_08045 [Burkholderiales bacterium]